MGKPGRLIVLEGADEAALDALGERLYRWLHGLGLAVERTRGPTNGPAGTLVQLCLQGRLQLGAESLALLWAADRLDHLAGDGTAGIEAWLDAGRHVLCVRNSLHAYAHLYDRVRLDWHRRVDARARVPDLILYLATARGGREAACGGHAVPASRGQSTALDNGYQRAVDALSAQGAPLVSLPPDGANAEDHVARLLYTPGFIVTTIAQHPEQSEWVAQQEMLRSATTMPPNPHPGRLIVIEGLDGAGTTTQIRMLGRRLSASRVTHEPSDGPIGLQIRLVLGHRVAVSEATLAALFAADRMDHLYHRTGEGGMVAHLARGVDVLTDRYYLSSFAYQGMSLDWDWIWDMHLRCIRPNLTLFVDVPVEVCLERIAAGRGRHFDLYENRRSLTKARESYLSAIERLRQAGETIAIVDGNAPPEDVHEAIWAQVAEL